MSSKLTSSCLIKKGEKYPGKEAFIKNYTKWLETKFSGAARRVLTGELASIRQADNKAYHPGDLALERDNQSEDEYARVMKGIKAKVPMGVEEELGTMSPFSVMPDSVRKGPMTASLSPIAEEGPESENVSAAPEFEAQAFEPLAGKSAEQMMDELDQMLKDKREMRANANKGEGNAISKAYYHSTRSCTAPPQRIAPTR